MSSLTLLIIRHGEKPLEAWPGPGLTEEGVADPQSLVIRGWQRAGSWTALFAAGLGGSNYPKPGAVYAADPKSYAGDDPSKRPWETVSGVAARLGRALNDRYGLGDEEAMVAEIVTLTGVVLLCWEHKRIFESILPALGRTHPIAGLPEKWHGSRFDVVLRLDRSDAGSEWSFRQLFPMLLAGDSDLPMQ